MKPRRGRAKPLVLAVDPDAGVRRLVAAVLESSGLEVAQAADGAAAVAASLELRPDAILLDVMLPGLSGAEALDKIRNDYRTAFIPVVFLTTRGLAADKVEHLISGADDYIVKPFDPGELAARVGMVLRRTAALREMNPISGLPGNNAISAAITNRLEARRPFACLYADLDSFKSFNDHYGFTRGDEVIRTLSEVILDALDDHPSPEHFAGHVGGDDFVVLTPAAAATEVAGSITARFDAAVPALYDAGDRRRGYIEVEDRRGQPARFAMVSVSVGIVCYPQRHLSSAAEVATAAAHMKEVAKREPGSSWALDRRRDGPAS